MKTNKYALWFGRLMWAGIIANLAIAGIAIAVPNGLFKVLGMPAASRVLWPRFAGVLLILLSGFYVSTADPLKTPTWAKLAVVSRFVGVTFFGVNVILGQTATYLIFGLYDLCFGLPQAILLYLALQPEHAPPRLPVRILRPWYAWAAIPVFVLLPAYGAWFFLFREQLVRHGSPEDHFKYGSVGIERESGIPYLIWLVLPRVFSDKLPGEGGYTSLGMNWEYGQELPVGFAKQTIGFPRVGLNCALCHATAYRKDEKDSVPTIVLGGPAQTMDAQAYLRFLFACASDARFNADVLLPEIGRVQALSLVEQQLYRRLLIPKTREALLAMKASYAWTDTRPNWGPGRIDPFNPVKFGILGLPVDATIGNSDMLPLWEMKQRKGGYHWDSLNSSVHEVVVSSAIGDGSPPKIINRPDVQESLSRVEEFINGLPAPKYPFPIDAAKAEQGKTVYAANCASCHGADGRGTDKIISPDEVGTDTNRLAMWTEQSAQAYNQYTASYAWKLHSFRKEQGYIAAPLTGLWLRAPYLHNGSVPSLKDLLEPVAQRPQDFYRGNDVYDPEAVGFASKKSAIVRNGIKRRFFRYDTTQPGNSNHGHVYGVNLTPDEKSTLIEFLKTL